MECKNNDVRHTDVVPPLSRGCTTSVHLYVIIFYTSCPRSHIKFVMITDIEYDINLQERRTDVVPPLSNNCLTLTT